MSFVYNLSIVFQLVRKVICWIAFNGKTLLLYLSIQLFMVMCTYTHIYIYIYTYKQSYLSSVVEMIIINNHGSLDICCWQYLFFSFFLTTNIYSEKKRNNKTGCCQFKIRFIHPAFWDNEKERVDWYRLGTAFVLKEEISDVLWYSYSSQCRFSLFLLAR